MFVALLRLLSIIHLFDAAVSETSSNSSSFSGLSTLGSLGAAAEDSAPGEGKGSSTFTSKLSSNLGELVQVVYMSTFVL